LSICLKDECNKRLEIPILTIPSVKEKVGLIILTHASHLLPSMRSILIQIPRWLKQPNVWRFVSSASSVVGLLCYALSSSFNHLFGKWTLLKVFLYSVFSLIIWVTILFAKISQHSSNLQLKAHLAYLVLMTTSVYSFFSDKVLNGKPDS